MRQERKDRTPLGTSLPVFTCPKVKGLKRTGPDFDRSMHLAALKCQDPPKTMEQGWASLSFALGGCLSKG